MQTLAIRYLESDSSISAFRHFVTINIIIIIIIIIINCLLFLLLTCVQIVIGLWAVKFALKINKNLIEYLFITRKDSSMNILIILYIILIQSNI
jgi:hypothetical protein